MAKRPHRASRAHRAPAQVRGQAPQPSPRAARGDGIVRIGREEQGRRGRGVTTISGLPLTSDRLRKLASELKRLCGSGGTIRLGVVEIQGDHRAAIASWLEDHGFSVEVAGR